MLSARGSAAKALPLPVVGAARRTASKEQGPVQGQPNKLDYGCGTYVDCRQWNPAGADLCHELLACAPDPEAALLSLSPQQRCSSVPMLGCCRSLCSLLSAPSTSLLQPCLPIMCWCGVLDPEGIEHPCHCKSFPFTLSCCRCPYIINSAQRQVRTPFEAVVMLPCSLM